MASILFLAIPLSILYALLLGFLRRSRDPLYDVPGPLLARWSPLWLAYHARRGDRYKAVHDAHQRYGTYVRISPWHVSIADASAIPIVYEKFGEGALPKSQYYDPFVAGMPSVFSVRDNAAHAQKRRLLSHAFSVRSLHNFVPFVHTMVEGFVQRLDTMCDTGKPVDMMLWFNYLTFDIISDLAFGEPLGMVEKGSDLIEVKTTSGTIHREHAIRIVEHREHVAAVLGTIPFLVPISRFLPDPFFQRGRASAKGLAFMARHGIRTRLSRGCKREDILNTLIAARLAGSPGDSVLSEEQVQELTAEAVTILIAGTHTGASSMAAILHLLRRHERVYNILMSELDEQVGEGQIPTYDQLRHLPYLQATITEGLRLHSTNAIGLPRSVPHGGIFFGGILFPEGVELSVPAWTIQHDEKLWGDPFTFRPERWLDPCCAAKHRKHLLNFGAGPRICLGKHIANMEMQVVLASMLLRYDITLESRKLVTCEGFQHQPVRMAVLLSSRRRAT